MKYLAIDYGIKRTGLAISDPAGIMAFPRTTLIMRGKDIFFDELLTVIKQESIEAVVIGLPIRNDGSDSEVTRMVRNMAGRLLRRSSLPVYFMEETLSSLEAEGLLREAGVAQHTMKRKLDQAAATAILESFLALSESTKKTLQVSSPPLGACGSRKDTTTGDLL